MKAKFNNEMALPSVEKASLDLKLVFANDAEIISFLKKFGSEEDVLLDTFGNVIGFFVQDAAMQQVYHSFPHVLCIDAAGYLLNKRMPFYLMLIEDSNGHSEIVALCVLERETRAGLHWFARTFRARNPLSTTKLEVLMVDTAITENGHRGAFVAAFPSASVLCCVEHSLRTFKRRLLEAGLTATESSMSMHFLKKMAYAVDQNEFNNHYKMLKLICPKSAVDRLFIQESHLLQVIGRAWRLCPKYFCGNLLRTKLRLKIISQKIYDTAQNCDTMNQFFDGFFGVLQELRSERELLAERMFDSKTRWVACDWSVFQLVNEWGSIVECYAKLLTDYAMLHICDQLLKSVTILLDQRFSSADVYTIPHEDGDIRAARTFCSCTFFRYMHLPCKHIFGVRLMHGLDLFVSDLCDEKWTVEYYQRQLMINEPFIRGGVWPSVIDSTSGSSLPHMVTDCSDVEIDWTSSVNQVKSDGVSKIRSILVMDTDHPVDHSKDLSIEEGPIMWDGTMKTTMNIPVNTSPSTRFTIQDPVNILTPSESNHFKPSPPKRGNQPISDEVSEIPSVPQTNAGPSVDESNDPSVGEGPFINGVTTVEAPINTPLDTSHCKTRVTAKDPRNSLATDKLNDVYLTSVRLNGQPASDVVAESPPTKCSPLISQAITLIPTDEPTFPIKVEIEEPEGSMVFDEAFMLSVTSCVQQSNDFHEEKVDHEMGHIQQHSLDTSGQQVDKCLKELFPMHDDKHNVQLQLQQFGGNFRQYLQDS